MSFSLNVKEELNRHIGSTRHCKIAEISAMLLYGAQFEWQNEELIELRFETESKSIAKKFYVLLQDTFGYEALIENRKTTKHTMHSIIINDKTMILKVIHATGIKCDQTYQIYINPMVIQSTCCKRAFLRGAFICAGSLCDPEKTYHLEIVNDFEQNAKELLELLKFFSIDAKQTMRKKYRIVYIKEGTQIVEFLNVVEAHISLMELENIRILKEMRNNVNRIVNCETANLNKTVSASYHQVESIELIMDTVGLEYLPDSLLEIAELRVQNPSMTLKELGNLLTTPVGKSGVNHRLRKIIEIADDLRSKRED